MEITRERTAERINQILNHPVVRPWVADAAEGELDISAAVANENNYCLMGEHGGVMLFKLLQGFYEVHTQILPTGRGKWTQEFLATATHWMFTRTDAVEILTRVPQGHLAAKAATLANHMEYEFTRPHECRFRGNLVDIDIYALRLEKWINHYPAFVERGHWFHERLLAEARRCGITQKPHEEDDNHAMVVGACFDMFMGGQFAKGTAIYNRWALVSRHQPAQLVSTHPPTIRMDIGLLKLQAGGIELVVPS